MLEGSAQTLHSPTRHSHDRTQFIGIANSRFKALARVVCACVPSRPKSVARGLPRKVYVKAEASALPSESLPAFNVTRAASLGFVTLQHIEPRILIPQRFTPSMDPKSMSCLGALNLELSVRALGKVNCFIPILST